MEKLEEEGVAEASGASARPGGSLREVRRGIRQWGVRETLSFTRPVRLRCGELEGKPRWPRGELGLGLGGDAEGTVRVGGFGTVASGTDGWE